ncbi:MAG: universal stress protein [Hamadaea sp.]|nr:universal stress protein [Hamadaea sp.]
MTEHKGAVVVGVDGSKEALAAVDLAAAEAVWRARPLHVVHGFIWPYLHVPLGPSDSGPPEGGLRHQADHLVEEAVERARATAPGLRVTGEVRTGSGGEVLIESSRSASLVVVGDRGLGAFAGLLLGSVAVHVAAHAGCPVLISRGTIRPDLPVLVAVDGSPANNAAIGFAFAAASARGVPVVALHVWAHPMSSGPGDMQPLVYDESLIQQDEERVLAEAVAGWHDRYPDLTVLRRTAHGRVRRTIIDAAAEAQLVVVGARGRGGFTGLLLGSVSQSVLHHSPCPTAIVRATR